MMQAAVEIFQDEQRKELKTLLFNSHQRESSQFLLNRELSLLEFFQRVLEEGLDHTQPLLERLKFLAILSSNLDEFFMIRVSGLKEKFDNKISPDGMTPEEQLAQIRSKVLAMTEIQMDCLQIDILPKLEEHGIMLARYDSLSVEEQSYLRRYFEEKIYPVVTPQAVDQTHPFPYVSGGNINIGTIVRPKLFSRAARYLKKHGDTFFMRVEIPPFIPRLVELENSPHKFVLTEDIISANIKMLVPEAEPQACFPFRITRDGDIELREDEAADLLEMMEENLKQRRFGDIVRLEVSKEMPAEILNLLVKSLEVSAEDIYLYDGILKVQDLMSLYKIDRPDLKDKPLTVKRPAILNHHESIFETIKHQDVLLHHPYMPYSIVTEFLAEAARDPDVLAIKMCLYRTGANSPIPPLLIKAAESGKQVTVLIELKARFDEENNIEWAKKLERAGVHVIYGILGLKTHCKTTLIIRREGNELRRYMHVATGNYNPETSAFYTDLGLLTANEQTGRDATELFNFLTAYKQSGTYQKLLVAPLNLRQKMVGLIKRETEHARQGVPAAITAKMNRLADIEIIRALYEASQAGVQIDLIVRGVCMLRPGVEGLSENIRVRSIVGSLLEHSRVYYFANGGDEEVYLGSSDWMPRNLDRRVEVLTPIENTGLKKYLKDEFLSVYLKDNVKARELRADGSFQKVAVNPNDEIVNSQMAFQPKSNVIDVNFTH
jgi:polyphosphate kinase